MPDRFSRTKMLLGEKAIEQLVNSRVIVFGAGGVGGYVIEALARCAVGSVDVVDNDTINITNINRQIIATQSSIGEYKVDVIKQRILDINPDIKIKTYNLFYSSETSDMFDFKKYDYIIDAIDSIKGKIELILKAKEANAPIISSMGTGNKINPSELQIDDIYNTSVCPLARVMRGELKKRGVKKLKVLYSREVPIKPLENEDNIRVGSVSFVPSSAGLLIASEVVKDLISKKI